MNLNCEKLALQSLNNVANERAREVLFLRFGLKDGQRQTLEAIGKKYGITRERVRQIEEAAFSDLRASGADKIFRPAFKLIDGFLNKEGRVSREERLLCALTSIDGAHPARGALFFILTLGDAYHRFVESDKFHSLWANEREAVARAENIVEGLAGELATVGTPLSFVQMLDLSKKFDNEIDERSLNSYLDATKKISQNSFGYFGLSRWPEISPRGARDKAYIILKEHKKPLHFREVAVLINEARLGVNVAQPQTVHNELIKDSRFILVGRGIYALREWGYQPGTVKEVISDILQNQGPLPKEEIIEKVLAKRLVKKNTILINLQNKQYFNRDQNGRYLPSR